MCIRIFKSVDGLMVKLVEESIENRLQVVRKATARTPAIDALLARYPPMPEQVPWQAHPDNPLISAARLIFAVVGRLRLTTQAPQVGVFRNHLIQQIGEFDQVLMRARVPREIAVSARYALCSFIDETVMSTPWGSVSDWQQHTLLTYFHQEGWGGEKFFEIVRQALVTAPPPSQAISHS